MASKQELSTLSGYAVLDLETTGLNYSENDRVIQIAIISTDWDGNITSIWSQYVKPQRRIAASHIHGITADMLRDKPTFSEIKETVLEKLKNRVIVAHNYDFDGNFIAREFSRYNELFKPYGVFNLCTQKTGVEFLPHLISHRLANCLADVGIDFADGGTGKHHDAEADAIATSKLLKHYINLDKGKLERLISRIS